MTIRVPSSVSILAFQRLRLETYTDVAAAALLVYDYLLTFSSEVDLIWPSALGLVKILFFLTRYLPFLDVAVVLYYQLKPSITVKTCGWTYSAAGWLIVIGIMLAEVIMVVRTWAIWGRDLRVGIGLLVIIITLVIPVLVIEDVFLKSIRFSPYPSPATPGCLLSAGNPIIAVSFIALMLFEILLLVLTLIKGVQHYRLANHRAFVVVLYRDGIMFYVYLLTVSVINVLVIVAAPRDLANLLAIFQRVLHSSLSARVLMHIRAAHRQDTGPTLDSTPLRDVVFQRPPLQGGTSCASDTLHSTVTAKASTSQGLTIPSTHTGSATLSVAASPLSDVVDVEVLDIR